MKITDLNGKRNRGHRPRKSDCTGRGFQRPSPPLSGDRERQAYWSDLHRKLLDLKSKKE